MKIELTTPADAGSNLIREGDPDTDAAIPERPAFCVTIRTSTYCSDEPPSDAAKACESILCAYARRQIDDLGLLLEWGRVLPARCGLLGVGDPDSIAMWTLNQFHECARNKDLPGLHLLVGGGLHEMILPADADTPLERLVKTNWPEGVSALLEFGEVDINARSSFGKGSVLHHAVAYTGSRMVAVLLEHGANPNLQDLMGWTPLHHVAAVSTNGTSIARMLAEHGANPHLRAFGSPGRTALDVARQDGHRDVARFIASLLSGKSKARA